MAMNKEMESGQFLACVKLLERFGARQVQIRYSDDEEPILWMVAVELYLKDGRPIALIEDADGRYWDCAAGMTPTLAALRLCEALGDGGTCTHCGRPSGISADFTETMPLDHLVCWYTYDPELKMFRRACEGDD